MIESTALPSLYARPLYDFDLRASHARTLLTAALASVSFGSGPEGLCLGCELRSVKRDSDRTEISFG